MSDAVLVVYEWSAWNDFLIRTIRPDARRLRADPGDRLDGILDRLPEQTRQFLFHLNVSRSARFPRHRARLVTALAERGVRVLNAAVVDTTKRHVQAICQLGGLPSASAPHTGDPDELLIVKSNLNHGGLKERPLSPLQRDVLDLPGEPDGLAADRRYPILPRRKVPPHCWRDDRLIVERYVTNAGNRFYRAYVLGNRLAVSEAISAQPIKEMLGDIPRRNMPFHVGARRDRAAESDLPAQLLPVLTQFIHRIGLDYGAIDVVADDHGLPHIVDVNPTPYWGAERQPDIVELLCDGWDHLVN